MTKSVKILVADKIPDQGIKILENNGAFHVDFKPEITQDEIVATIADYDALVVRSRAKAPKDVIEKGKKLKVIGRAGVGVDNVDVKAATEAGIIVMNTPGGNTISTAELTIAMMLSLARHIPAADKTMKEKKWDKKSFTGVEVFGKTLGVIGCGRIGSEVIKRMQAFGMTVLAYDPFIPPEGIKKLGAEPTTVEEIVKNSDFITVHTPKTAETAGIIGENEFKYMKKTARIINCARGGIIDEQALYNALKEERIAGAAIDVYSTEPLPDDSPFRELKNCVLTPHLGASSKEAQMNVALQVAEQIVEVLKGGEIKNAVNAPSVDPQILAELRPYLNLAEKLGKFLSQYLKNDRVKKLTVKYSGAVLDFPTAPITTAFMIGFFQRISTGVVNFVNALNHAEQHGVEIVESKTNILYQYTNLLSLEAKTEDGKELAISGSLLTPEMPSIVMFNDKHFNAMPEGNLIVIENNDVPGIIGAVGTLLGEKKVNIDQLTWGKSEKAGTALTIININQEIKDDLIKAISKLKDIVAVQGIAL